VWAIITGPALETLRFRMGNVSMDRELTSLLHRECEVVGRSEELKEGSARCAYPR